MPTYTTIAQRITEAKRRGCKVQKTVSGSVYDLDNLPLYDPDHDADCRTHGVSIVEPEVPPPLAPCPKCGGKCRLHGSDPNRVICDADGCSYGFGWWQVDEVRLADHPVRPDRTGEIVALFRELNERLGKLLEGKS